MESGELLDRFVQRVGELLASTSEASVLSQVGIIAGVYALAFVVTHRLQRYVPALRRPPQSPELHPLRMMAYRCGRLLFPLLAIVLLKVAVVFIPQFIGQSWVVQTALAVAIILLFNSFVRVVVTNPAAAHIFRWVGMPILFLYVVGALDDIVQVLDAMAVEIGNIRLSAYGIARTVIFGSLLFWLGRVSNSTGQNIIRKQETLDFRTREVAAKLFEIGLFTLVALLILQLMGINLTALAVFGGAVGVGVGFGLQTIASNFISGIIILLDRSVTVGDYIELEDGRTGLVTRLNMRSTTLETFDGKDIVVPNEKFVSNSFINWTHKNKKQRYRVDFSVSYSTNIREMVEIIKAAVASHPQVLSGDHLPLEERPDCEIDSFGDSGVNMFVEFWMEGIDDGRNRVGGDLLLIIFETLQRHGIEIPFPQRDVRVVSTRKTSASEVLST
ncbi:mechanosensitive ion channel family protein [Microbulbifer yueqingensis]|uniref:Mechanosensitive ion channel n=1 Tax=Microbulbifer yueqingensis TaxID=658219 RepID=A0A1G8UM81_9GAMM|nr:mechanosensitive ion channel domain-containing protein [Microbulbifer yueqingensis]SDJ54265.1 Mechanosensitive ion channel [Microbulbifer yueqingensis]